MVLRFGAVEFDVDAMLLRRDGAPVPVEPQVFDVLAALIRNRDRVVTKAELLRTVWGERFVSDSALTSRIKSARKAVGDNGRDQRLIRTIHGRGFRFVGDVSEGAALETRRETDDRVRLAADRLSLGRGIAVRIVGPVGSGKTELLERLAAEAGAAGALVGRAHGAAVLRAFGPVVQAFDEWLQRRPELLDGLPAGCRDELRAVLAGRAPSTRQRLLVAAGELAAAAARGRGGAALALDDVHFLDEASLQLVQHLVRWTTRLPLALLVSHLPGVPLGAGLVEIALAPPSGAPASRLRALPEPVRGVLRRVALLGEAFDHDELAAAAAVDEPERDRVLDVALAAGLLESVGQGLRFTDPADSAQLRDELPAHRQRSIHREVAAAIAARGGSPERVARHFVAAGDGNAAAPHALAAARLAAAAHLHAEVVRWTGLAGDKLVGDERSELLALRAEALLAMGDLSAIPVFREGLATPGANPSPALRARLGRALLVAGDLQGAGEVLDALRTDGRPDDGPVLLARGMLQYFRGDLDGAEAILETARGLMLQPGAPARMVDVVTLQGLIAHNRGRWFDRLDFELRFAGDRTELASTLFDGHLCVAQYLLYGPTPLPEVIRLATGLRESAERIGSRPAAAFARTLVGEARLLSGDVAPARDELEAAARINREIGAGAGEAHALQRLADAALADGDRATAEDFCRRALPHARWSPLAHHLLQRIYGTLIAAAPDAAAARQLVSEAEAILDEPAACPFCQVMLEVPATTACAGAGDLDDARRHLAAARRSANLWEGRAWWAAVTEAEACIAQAEGDRGSAERGFSRAADAFEEAGHRLDAARCRDALEG